MATLPRSTKGSAFQGRPHSDFDAGLNASAAWTEHLEASSIASSNDDQENGRPARALYDFDGKAEFRELSVKAGDELQVLREELPDGWSLVKADTGETGLLPQTYYTFTSDFTVSPGVELPGPSSFSKFRKREREPSTNSITPRASPRNSVQPIIPQNTGEWMFPSFRQSLLGGKSLNRFSNFVTSGAEAWVLKGKAADATLISSTFPTIHEKSKSASDDYDEEVVEEEDSDDATGSNNRLSQIGLGEADRHFVDGGHAWKSKLPLFRVLVHSPSKRASVLSGAYTVYNVTSLFHATPTSDSEMDPPGSPTRITVQRRFSQFVVLHTALTRRLPGIALPPLPEKQYAGRFSEDFVEARRGDLERYINKVVRHPVARYAEVVTFFLGCENDTEWKRRVPHHLSMPPAGPSFYAHVFHPAFNVDLEDAEEAVGRFSTHTKAVGKGVQGLRSIFGRVRDARVEMSKAERLLSYSLLSLITSKPLASAPTTGVAEEDEDYNSKDKGLINDEGAWCWREGCKLCLGMTKAMQRTAEILQGIADLYDDHARRTQLATHEGLKGVSHPSSIYDGVISTHRSTLTRYREATSDNHADEEMASRCETVLNTTMAEMETYHAQKVQDFSSLTKEHLDGEIALYEQILTRLQTARRSFDYPQVQELSSSPRQPSIYERELEHPRLGAEPLLQPCPHVFDSAPMRPVSVAIQEGVGILTGRGSVFGKFW
ncbi:PX-domain-containing protein [Marasmius fiardii PR-910]|nr:PX-domain-containing protein [Marasmius fiardii PR-910]